MTQAPVRADVAKFLDGLASLPGPRMHELDVAAARAQFRAMRDVADLPMGPLAVIRDLTVQTPAGPLAARLFDAAETRPPGPAVLFFHGGGFVIGDLDSHAPFCAEMARVLDLPVIALEYRLAPETPWPGAVDDAEEAARWIATAPTALGRAVTALVLVGDSAGGKLVITTAQALRDRPAAVPAIAQWAIYPTTDWSRDYPSFDQFAAGYMLTREGLEWFGAAYRSDHHDPRGSPLLGSMAGLPPALVLTAGLDPIRDQGRAYAAALAGAGVPVIFREAVGNVHGFINLRRVIPSSVGDVAGALAALKAMVAEAEAQRVMAQAAGAL